MSTNKENKEPRQMFFMNYCFTFINKIKLEWKKDFQVFFTPFLFFLETFLIFLRQGLRRIDWEKGPESFYYPDLTIPILLQVLRKILMKTLSENWIQEKLILQIDTQLSFQGIKRQKLSQQRSHAINFIDHMPLMHNMKEKSRKKQTHWKNIFSKYRKRIKYDYVLNYLKKY